MSTHAADVDFVMALVHGLMAVLFVGWGAYFVWALVRFRRGRNPRATYDGPRGRLTFATEVGVVAAEVVLLVVFALPVWFRQTSAQPVDPQALTVRVVAEQFLWNVHYPGADNEFGETRLDLVSPTNPIGLDRRSAHGADDLVIPNQLRVPVNRQVVVQLSSKDVIHSFGVAAMRVKMDAIPGLLSPLWFTPTTIGEYDIACSQLCGMGHYRMRGVVIVQSEADFRAFLTEEAGVQTGR